MSTVPLEPSSCPAPTVLVPARIAASRSAIESPRAASADTSALTRTADFVPNTFTRLTPGRMLMRCPTCVEPKS